MIGTDSHTRTQLPTQEYGLLAHEQRQDTDRDTKFNDTVDEHTDALQVCQECQCVSEATQHVAVLHESSSDLITRRNPHDQPQQTIACTSSTVTDTATKKRIASYWDHLPVELTEAILGIAGPLTRFLTGNITINPQYPNKPMIRSIWLDTFDMDWQGDLSLLPDTPHDTLLNTDLVRVRSRSMYQRLCQRFPNSVDGGDRFSHVDECFDRYAPSTVDDDVSITITRRSSDTDTVSPDIARRLPACIACDMYSMHPTRLVSPLRVIHVAMHQLWFDVLEQSPLITKYPVTTAYHCVVGGHARLLKYLVEKGLVELGLMRHVPRPRGMVDVVHVMDLAAKYGHTDILDLFHSAGCVCTKKGMDDAVRYGRVGVVRWLCTNQPQTGSSESMDVAARMGRLDMVRIMHDSGMKCTTKAMDGAAYNGHINMVKWLHENRDEGCTTNAMDEAASMGHLDIVKFFHEHRREGCTTNAMDNAASNGKIRVVEWLHENRDEGCTKNAMDQAASNGHLEVVKFLHKYRTEGCTTNAMDGAAANGQITMLAWLHEHRNEGCTTKAVDSAVTRPLHADKVVSWLLEHRSEGFTSTAINKALSANLVRMLVEYVEKLPNATERKNELIEQAKERMQMLVAPRLNGDYSAGMHKSAAPRILFY